MAKFEAPGIKEYAYMTMCMENVAGEQSLAIQHFFPIQILFF